MMARGRVLYDVIVPLVGRHLQSIDDHVAARFEQMCARYGLWWYPDEPRGFLQLREPEAGYGSVPQRTEVFHRATGSFT